MSIQALLDEVQKCQKHVSDVQQMLSDLKQADTKEQEKINQAEEDNQEMIDLAREEEDLLAEVAAGDTTNTARLELIGKQLSASSLDHSDRLLMATRAKRVVSGLLRKIQSTELALTRAKDAFRLAFLEYLTAMAENEGKEYKRLATLLMKKSERITAIGRILERLPGDTSLHPIYSGHNEKFLVPGFNLESCRGAVQGDIWRLAIVTPESVADAVEAMKSEIKSLGVEFPG